MSEKRVFVGLDEREQYFEALHQVDGGTLSPGGAAAVLRVSRQGIWDLIDRGKLRVWYHYESTADQRRRRGFIEVSLRDVVEHGVRMGRIRQYEDVGLYGELVRREVERALVLSGVSGTGELDVCQVPR
jgi:hypothetical protein